MVQNWEEASNIHSIWFYFENKYSINLLQKLINKLNTNSLRHFWIEALRMTLKDVMKLIHKLDNWTRLIIVEGQVYGDPKDLRLSTKVRFELEKLFFDEWAYNFELKDLAKVLIRNESLRQKLTLGCSKNFSENKIILKDLEA